MPLLRSGRSARSSLCSWPSLMPPGARATHARACGPKLTHPRAAALSPTPCQDCASRNANCPRRFKLLALPSISYRPETSTRSVVVACCFSVALCTPIHLFARSVASHADSHQSPAPPFLSKSTITELTRLPLTIVMVLAGALPWATSGMVVGVIAP
jgi:hypothetical protein